MVGKMKKNSIFIILSIILFACSTSKETTQSGEDKIYVFDDVSTVTDSTATVETPSVKDTLTLEQPKVEKHFIYFVQIGAFSSQERAERFKLFNQPKCSYPMDISFNNDIQLWVIRLPKFNTKEEAEKVRDELWKQEVFKDAFIVTVEE